MPTLPCIVSWGDAGSGNRGEGCDAAQRQLRHDDYVMTAQVGAQHVPPTLFGAPLRMLMQVCSCRLEQMCTTCPITSR